MLPGCDLPFALDEAALRREGARLLELHPGPVRLSLLQVRLGQTDVSAHGAGINGERPLQQLDGGAQVAAEGRGSLELVCRVADEGAGILRHPVQRELVVLRRPASVAEATEDAFQEPEAAVIVAEQPVGVGVGPAPEVQRALQVRDAFAARFPRQLRLARPVEEVDLGEEGAREKVPVRGVLGLPIRESGQLVNHELNLGPVVAHLGGGHPALEAPVRAPLGRGQRCRRENRRGGQQPRSPHEGSMGHFRSFARLAGGVGLPGGQT